MKPQYLLILTFTLPFLISNSISHEYYVSVTEVEYAEEQQALQIISQIFIDDFETLLRKRYDESITLATEDELEMVDTYMSRYVSDKLKIVINGEDVNFKFIGKEYRDDIAYCYLEIENVSNIKYIEVTNQILFDAFSDQQNIVRLKLQGKNKSFLLVPGNDSCVLKFN
ncbi:peptidase E [Winogradskyella psychrotolerans]|nr:peptidase E [Winogradskyella psychrotolerans]